MLPTFKKFDVVVLRHDYESPETQIIYKRPKAVVMYDPGTTKTLELKVFDENKIIGDLLIEDTEVLLFNKTIVFDV